MALRPKSSVRYRMGGAHCGMCEYYVEGENETGTCKLVAGPISEDGLCDLFKGTQREPGLPKADGKPRFAQKANVY